MKESVSLVTLGVRDLKRARAFYSALGWRGREVEETVFYQAGRLVIVLWSRAKLAADAGVSDDGGSFGGVALAHNVASRDEVDAVVSAAERAGAAVTQRPRETFYGGYAGYFRDPEGHLWEVAHNPGFALADDGTVTLPSFGSSV